MGIPVLTMELAIGRASKKSAVLAYKKLEKPKSKWHIHGWFCILGCYLLMMYYTPVSGWMLSYFFKFATGTFESGMTAEQVGNVFSNLMSNPVEMIIWMAVMAIAGFFVCSKGIQNGIEKVSKVMMILLLALIIILAINSLTLSGAAEGIKFYLVPDLEKVQSIGIGHIITSAMSQAFFTLSLGIASMEILGSYMTREKTLPSESIKICILDTFVAITAGLIIFPACFSYGVEPNQGPALIFVTLPNVFVNMAGGRIWGTLFFMFMTFACFSTVIAVFENLISFCIDMFNMSRTKSVIINAIIMLIGCLPCIFGFNLLSGFNILGKGVLDIEDFAVSNILLPVGAFLYSLFCSTKFGWGFDGYLNECNQGEGIKFPRFFKPYIKYVLPVLVLIVFISGFIPQG
jgi:NSS family neurotransmitter:Na+ symporter